MAVKPEEDIRASLWTREKVARMCDECPTLKKLEPYIQSSRIYWAGSEENEKDWEIRDGWVFWIFLYRSGAGRIIIRMAGQSIR